VNSVKMHMYNKEARVEWMAAKINDRALRATFADAVTDNAQEYSEAERKQIQEGLKMEAEVTESTDLKPIKISTPLLDKAVAMTSKDGQHNIVQSSATIRAPLMDVVAFLFCIEQEVNKIRDSETGARNELLESKNEHCLVMQFGVRFPRPLSHRDTVLRTIYQELESGDHVLSITSTEHAAAARRDNTVRFTGSRLFRFSQITPTVTRFTATATFDLCGSIPKFISDTLTTPTAVRAPLYTLGYFINIKENADLDAAGQDARALGQLLVHEMEPLETAHPFSRPFMNEIAKHILSVADFGLKMRLFSGAGLSVFDLMSDVYMIVVFLGSEETRGVAYVNIA
ncbi:hypothetical protein TeGR_g4072, partial [Tetraparma gracilis]